jgi:hypothetical protein
MASNGYKRVYTGSLYVGNVTATSTSLGFTYDGIITSVSYTYGGGNGSYFALTHGAIPFSYVVNVQQYANRVNAHDNTAGTVNAWVYAVSPTSTYIVFEYDASGDKSN